MRYIILVLLLSGCTPPCIEMPQDQMLVERDYHWAATGLDGKMQYYIQDRYYGNCAMHLRNTRIVTKKEWEDAIH